VNKLSWKRSRGNMSLKRKRKQDVNRKKRTKPLKMKERKTPKEVLKITSKENQLKNLNKARMKQREVQNPNLIPTKAPSKKTLASLTTHPSTTSQVSFRRLL